MQDYVIVTDSGCDLPQNIIEKAEISVISFELTFDGEHYFSGAEINHENFYKELRSGKLPKTTQINSAKFTEYFEQFLKKKLDVIYICFSSALSGTYASALAAAKDLNQIFKNKVIVVDSLCASMGQGMLVCEAAEKKKTGYSVEDLEKWLNENKSRLYHVATVNDLFHLKRGGRLSASAAMVGTLLNVKPMLKINEKGALEAFSKIRGRKAAIAALVDNMSQNMVVEENKTVFIAHSDCQDDADFLAAEINKKFGVKNFVVNFIGPVIGSHIGPEALVVFYWAKGR